MSFFNGITDLNTGTLNVGGTSNMSGTVNIAGNLNTIGLDNCNDLLVNNSATIGALPSSTKHYQYSLNGTPNMVGLPSPSNLDLDGVIPPVSSANPNQQLPYSSFPPQ